MDRGVCWGISLPYASLNFSGVLPATNIGPDGSYVCAVTQQKCPSNDCEKDDKGKDGKKW